MDATRTEKSTSEQIDRIVASARRAVGKLIGFLGDDDPEVLRQVAGALVEIGPFAIGPLAAALPRGTSLRHRAAIIGALITFGPHDTVAVLRALTRAIESDPDPHVRLAAQMALSSLLLSEMAQPPSAATGTSRPTSTTPRRTATQQV